MDEALQRYGPLIGRILLSFMFIISGIQKIPGFSGTAAHMASHGLPFVPLLLVLTILIEAGGGLMILLGWHARLAALVIFLYLIPVTLVFHNFWAADAAHFEGQTINFMKNLTIMGGMLYVLAFGAGEYSLDNSAGRRRVLAW
jgi:putative oxidoreductase